MKNNRVYKFHFRRRWFWKSVTVIGHRFEKDQDKMVLYFTDGALQEIAQWSKCEMYLGLDWLMAVKSSQERQIGQSIPLAVG